MTENKRSLIVSVLTKIPRAAVRKFLDHLHERTWGRSGVNQQLLGLRELRLNYCPSGCAGVWASYLRNSPAACVDIAHFICCHFEDKIPKPEASARKSDVQASRAKAEEVVAFQAASSLRHGWLKGEVAEREPWAVDAVEKAWTERAFVTDLCRISQSKVSAATGQKLTYRGVGSLSTLLRQQKVLCGPLCGEHKRKMDEGKRAEFAALAVKIQRIQEDFIEHIERRSGQLMEMAVERMDLLTQNCDLFSQVSEQFSSAHCRIVHLDAPMTASVVINEMRNTVRGQWPGVHDVPTLIVVNVADVPLPRGVSDKDAKAVKAARVGAEEDDATATQLGLGLGDPRAERGTKADWIQMLGSAACTMHSSPSFMMLLMAHALRAPRSVNAVPLYNLDFIKTLVESRLNVDNEVLLTWDKDSSGRPPRRATLALKSDVHNIFEGVVGVQVAAVRPRVRSRQRDWPRRRRMRTTRTRTGTWSKTTTLHCLTSRRPRSAALLRPRPPRGSPRLCSSLPWAPPTATSLSLLSMPPSRAARRRAPSSWSCLRRRASLPSSASTKSSTRSGKLAGSSGTALCRRSTGRTWRRTARTPTTARPWVSEVGFADSGGASRTAL